MPAVFFMPFQQSYKIRMIGILLVSFLVVLMSSFSAHASKRVALVIGNSAYKNASALENPANDAEDMAMALEDLGFIVVKGVDLDSRSMRQKVREFSHVLRGAETAMLYYAGHAMQVNGQNYLAPVDTVLEYESDLDFETIPLKFIQAQMEREAKTSLLFLDACRDNPLTRSFKSSTRSQGAGKGLAKESLASSGILIAFATNPENVALDGSGRNSPFTRAMLDNIKRPGVEISSLMTDVRVQVVKDTYGKQTPWINSALLGRFYFNPEEEKEVEVKMATVEPVKKEEIMVPAQPLVRSTAGVDNAQIASLAYDAVKDLNDIEELEVFLSLYGDSFYGKLVKIKIARLKKAAGMMADDKPKTREVTKPTTKIEIAEIIPEKLPKPKMEPEIEVAALNPEKVIAAKVLIEGNANEEKFKFGIQEELVRLKCNPGRPDGVWGKKSQNALDSFSKRLKLVSAKPSAELYNQLKEYFGKGCFIPKKKKKDVKIHKKKVVKACRSGYRRSSKGVCYKPKAKVKRCKKGYRKNSKGKCYKPKVRKAKKTYKKKSYTPKRRSYSGYSNY